MATVDDRCTAEQQSSAEPLVYCKAQRCWSRYVNLEVKVGELPTHLWQTIKKHTHTRNVCSWAKLPWSDYFLTHLIFSCCLIHLALFLQTDQMKWCFLQLLYVGYTLPISLNKVDQSCWVPILPVSKEILRAPNTENWNCSLFSTQIPFVINYRTSNLNFIQMKQWCWLTSMVHRIFSSWLWMFASA